MRNIDAYLNSLPPKNDPSFEPPCCPQLESMFHKIFTNPHILFDSAKGIFVLENNIVARFMSVNITGGENWQPSLVTSRLELVLIKNPNRSQNFLSNFGERNGIVMINRAPGLLIAVAPIIPATLEIRRPVRQSHLPTGSTKLITEFQKYAEQFSSVH